MNHDERQHLAETLCNQMVAHYGDDLLISGVYGSTAAGTDTAYSDLEMLFVVRDRSKLQERHLIYRGTPVGLHVIQRGQLKDMLANPSLRWPYWMGVLSVLKVLHGDPAQVETWLRAGQAVPIDRFHAALEASLPELIIESYGRIFSCRERGNTHDMAIAALEVLMEMNLALCLLNRAWVTHDYYQGLVDAFIFPKLPTDYATLATALWSARDIHEIVPLAETLVGNFWRLLNEEGIHIPDYTSTDDISL
jgi:kanamycin nucleotidyltransferase